MSLFFYVGLFTSFAQTHSPSNSMNLILSSPNGPQKVIGPTLYQVSIRGYWILGRWGWQNGKIPGVPQWESPWAWHTQSTQPLKCFAAIILCQKPTAWGSLVWTSKCPMKPPVLPKNHHSMGWLSHLQVQGTTTGYHSSGLCSSTRITGGLRPT